MSSRTEYLQLIFFLINDEKILVLNMSWNQLQKAKQRIIWVTMTYMHI